MNKQKIINPKKEKCEICKKTYFGKGMHLHHVDGNFLNNQPKNVMSLCARCHNLWHSKHKIKHYLALKMSIRVNQAMSHFMKDNNYAPSLIFYEALKNLGFKEK